MGRSIVSGVDGASLAQRFLTEFQSHKCDLGVSLCGKEETEMSAKVSIRFDQQLRSNLEQLARRRALQTSTNVTWVRLLHVAAERLLKEANLSGQ